MKKWFKKYVWYRKQYEKWNRIVYIVSFSITVICMAFFLFAQYSPVIVDWNYIELATTLWLMIVAFCLGSSETLVRVDKYEKKMSETK